MAGKGGKYRLIILVIAALAVAGCSFPVGSIGDLANLVIYDGLWVEPQRLVYETGGDPFKPVKEHLRVYTTYRGETEEVDLAECQISVMEDPASTPVPVPPAGYSFSSAGIKAIQVKYLNLSTQYYIDVRKPADENKPAGIIIEWEDDNP